MDQGQLVSEEIDAGAELVRRLDQYVPVKAAFWVKDSEEGQWYLYIASDQITDTNLGAAYYPGSKEGHIPTRSASEGSGAFPSLARRVNMQQHAELPCRGNMDKSCVWLANSPVPTSTRFWSS